MRPSPTTLTRRSAVAAALAFGLPVARASIAPPEVLAELPGASLVGSGRMRFLGLSVYDVRLWGSQRVAPARFADTPLALEIEYARALVGRQIAERSIEEMRRIGTFSDAQAQRWLARLTDLLPDVARGDRITGVQRPHEAARFFVNGRFTGELRDPAFVPLFFGIWLAPQTSQPDLRASLLGA